jgi:hypothetical protein
VTWRDGTAEGWAWLEVRDGLCLFERTRIWQPGFSCGVDPSRLAEDLATAAIGERLRALGGGEQPLRTLGGGERPLRALGGGERPLRALGGGERPLRDRRTLGREFEDLRRRRDEMVADFAYDHISFE